MVKTNRVTLWLARATFLFVFVFLFCPVLVRPSLAEEPVVPENNSDCTKGIVLKTTSAEFEVSPSNTNGAFGYGYMTITGCTSNSSGFTVTMRSSTEDARLVYSKAGINQYIDTIPNAAEVSANVNEFPAKGWGWGLSNIVDPEHGIDGRTGYGVYSPIPTSLQTPVVVGSTGSAGTHSTVIYFGAKANTDILYGKYVNTVVVTAIDNTVVTPPVSLTFDAAFEGYGANKVSANDGQQYYRMQDMSIDLCGSVAPNEITTLIDIRDGKTYGALKTADGNCWMTNNLALGDNAATTLTSTDSDVSSNYVLPATQTSEDGSIDWSTPNSLLGTQGTNYQPNDSNHVYATGNSSYGNYYTWYTATAGTGGSRKTDLATATNSICPKGWTLPTVAQYTALSNAYAGDASTTGSIRSGESPLSYAYSGGYLSDPGSQDISYAVWYQDVAGIYWSSQSYDAGSAYSLYFTSATITPNNGSTKRNDGSAIRCVARSDVHSYPLPENDPGMTGGDDLGQGGTIAMRTIASAPSSPSNPGMSGNLDDENAPAQGVTDETELSAATLAAVKHMEALIENLPSATGINMSYSEMIESAISAWNALSDLERSLVDSYLSMKYEAVVAAYQSLLDNQPINGILVAAGLTAAAVATGVIVVAAAKKNRNERYYGDE